MSSNGDTYFSKVVLLLQGDTLIDQSNNNLKASLNGAQITTALPSVAGASFWLTDDLHGQPLFVQSLTSTALVADEDVTIEFSAFCQKNRLGSALFSNRIDQGVASGIFVGIDQTGKVFVRITSNGKLMVVINTYRPVTFDALHVFALVRKGTTWTLYIDGVANVDIRNNASFSGAIDGGMKWYLGCDPYTAPMIGAISQVRVTRNVARYATNYPVPLVPFNSFSDTPNVVFSDLSTHVSIKDTTFTATLTMTNTQSATVRAVNGSNLPVGSNWNITSTSYRGNTIWTITGTAPSSLTGYHLIVTATEPASLGGYQVSKTYSVINTLNGQESPEQALLYGIGDVAMWLDAADQTTLTSSSSNVTQFLDKTLGVPFLPMPGAPSPTVDVGTFVNAAISFPNGAASGLSATTPMVVTDEQSECTLFVVGCYNGTQVGQGAGTFKLSYLADPTTFDGMPSWGMTTSQVGMNDASFFFYDGSPTQNGVTSSPVLMSGQKFIAVWKSNSTSFDLYVNQRLVTTAPISGHSVYSAASAAIGFIGGAQSPTGSFVTVGEVVAFSSHLSQSDTEIVESYLNHKWSIYPLVPFVEEPNVLQGYMGQPYLAEVVVVDATSVSVSASAGTNWTMSLLTSGQQAVYSITGTLPSYATTVDLTFNSANGSVIGTDTYTVNVQAVPDIPIIQPPSNRYCQVSVGYVSYIEILNATTYEITADAGSNWSIAQAHHPDPNQYVILGTMPSTVGPVTLTITAHYTPAVGDPITVINTFVIYATAQAQLLPSQYPLDLTGLLPSNKITREKQTLTMLNGIRKQILVPTFSPYFGESLVVERRSASTAFQTLTHGVDYELAYKYEELSRVTQTPIYGGIVFLKPSLHGTIYLTYQTVGGNLSFDKQKAILELFDDSFNTRKIPWSSVTAKPYNFPVGKHSLNVNSEAIGLSNTVSALDLIKIAVQSLPEAGDVAALNAHKLDLNNPHQLTKASIGLGSVQNYPLATLAQAQETGNASTYLTPKTLAKAASVFIAQATTNAYGAAKLNTGTAPADLTDATKALTASSLVNLATIAPTNPIKTFVNQYIKNVQQEVPVTPNPLVFPLWWRGVKYDTLDAFIFGVQTLVGVSPLTYDENKGVMLFPIDVLAPTLATTSTMLMVNPTKASVNQPIGSLVRSSA